jgi:heterogeneous nuclear ribonucleoprotein K
MADEGNSQGIKRSHDDDDMDQPSPNEHARLLKKRRGEGPHVELRILLASKNAGAIIGKGGSNIKRLRSDFKAGVTVPDSSGPERILTVGANLGTVSEILLEVIPLLEDYQQYKDLDFECDIRMLVHQSQAGCIIGRAGFKIKELREETGANIKVYSQCAPQSTERVVQVTGQPTTVINCITTIFELLQSAPPKGFSSPYDPHNYDEYYAEEYGGFTIADSSRRGGGMGRGGGRGGGRGSFSRGGGMDRDYGGGMRSGRGGRGGGMGGMGMGGMGGGMRGRGGHGGRGSGRGFGRGNMNGFGSRSSGGMGGMGELKRMGGGGGMSQNFTQDTMVSSRDAYSSYDDEGGMGDQGMMFGGNHPTTSTQVSIPKDLAGAIIGKGGSRIRQIRQESGAGITIDEAVAGSSDRIITITGTQEAIQNAQYLLQMSVKQQ